MSDKQPETLPSTLIDQLTAEAGFQSEECEEVARSLIDTALYNERTLHEMGKGNYYPVPGDLDVSHQRAFCHGSLETCYAVLDTLGTVEQGWRERIGTAAVPSAEVT